jgi:hydroxymethylbilane synthase
MTDLRQGADCTPEPFVLATRGSTLALWQARFVSQQLHTLGLNVSIQTWKTTGDMVQDRFLHEIGGKGLFIKELEDAMRQGSAHFAVHSLKDMPANIPTGFLLAAVLKRHQSSDIIIFKSSLWSRLGLQPKSIVSANTLNQLGQLNIATSSLRRQALLKSACPNIITTPIRGNVDTRLKKLETEGQWDAIILAEASLERLDIQDVHAHRIDPEWFIPCAGQGALAIEAPASSPILNRLVQLECPDTRLAVNVERAVLARLGGDCTMPFGCLVSRNLTAPNCLDGRAIILSNHGHYARASVSIDTDHADAENLLIEALIKGLREDGANTILQSLGLPVRI